MFGVIENYFFLNVEFKFDTQEKQSNKINKQIREEGNPQRENKEYKPKRERENNLKSIFNNTRRICLR